MGLVPCVEVAEEARASTEPGSREIFNMIVGEPTRFSVMDDYTRTVHEPRPGAFLNGDTQVRICLGYRRKLQRQEVIFVDEEEGECFLAGDAVEDGKPAMDICEDMLVGLETNYPPPATGVDLTDLLLNPLPADLPAVDKDVLIAMAAYNGDVGRYARLRRPAPLSWWERMFVIRGIYHNPLFGAWWARRPAEERRTVQAAVHARAIMSNDLTRITADTPDGEMPYFIWYPHWPNHNVLRALLRLKVRSVPFRLPWCQIFQWSPFLIRFFFANA